MKFLILLTLCFPIVAFGRIGETYDQCVTRYGQPVFSDRPAQFTFQKGYFRVQVLLDASNRVERISYSAPRVLAKEDIDTLLKANADEPWKMLPRTDPDYLLYQASRTGLTATASGNQLIVWTPQYEHRMNIERHRQTQSADDR